jgi:hypothetical protein
MYNSQLDTTVTHLHATFGTGLAKRFPQFIHGAAHIGMATSSDPITGKVSNWGLSAIPPFIAFSHMYPSDPLYGLGAGEVIGNPNVMDVSQPHGMVYGGGFPAGDILLRVPTEQREQVLMPRAAKPKPGVGIPRTNPSKDGISAIWIAKSTAIPSLSEGLIGIMSGHHSGIVTAYSLGKDDLGHLRLLRGDVTARWVLSPGVPIVAFAVDENYSLKRQAQNRIWAVALNALGELFYLTKIPKNSSTKPFGREGRTDMAIAQRSWLTGRTVHWNLIEASRRNARPDPFNENQSDGSYSPRSSWNGMCLTPEQIKAETREIEGFMAMKPIYFRKICLGWDMQRRLEVDFAGDDGNFAGEALVVVNCGLNDESPASLTRYTRLRVKDHEATSALEEPASFENQQTPVVERESLFGPSPPFAIQHRTPECPHLGRGRGSSSVSRSSAEPSPERGHLVEEWRQSQFAFNGTKNVQISATAIDISTFATLTISEDPALGLTTASETSSPIGSPLPGSAQVQTPDNLPGQRSRFIAAGTKTGSVFVWDVRSPISKTAEIVNTIDPVRIIYTDSPEISCLALTALQLVHGGNDGLVQAWDPLASTSTPIRTLNSRFSSRARRRLVQAQASTQGIGINLFAAGAVVLDPDPTVLRGMVSLGTHLRYWSYSSTGADQYKGSKRHLRRGERGSNPHGGERAATTVRNAGIENYIVSEWAAHRHERQVREKEHMHLTNRFGLGMYGSEEEALAYARMLSEESLAQDEERRRSSAASTPAARSSTWTSAPVTHEGSPQLKAQDEFDAEVVEAIQRSLDQEEEASRHITTLPPLSSSCVGTPYDVPIRYSTKKSGKTSPRRGASRSPKLASDAGPVGVAGSSGEREAKDLEFALQLSLAEEQSRKEVFGDETEEFPALNAKGKGKGRAD